MINQTPESIRAMLGDHTTIHNGVSITETTTAICIIHPDMTWVVQKNGQDMNKNELLSAFKNTLTTLRPDTTCGDPHQSSC